MIRFVSGQPFLIAYYVSSNDGSSHLLCEPLLSFIGTDLLEFAESVSGMLSSGDSLASSGQDNIEVHAENTSAHIIFDSEIDMLLNTESEVALIREIIFLELVLLNSQSFLKELFGLFATNCNMHCYLLISLD